MKVVEWTEVHRGGGRVDGWIQHTAREEYATTTRARRGRRNYSGSYFSVYIFSAFSDLLCVKDQDIYMYI